MSDYSHTPNRAQVYEAIDANLKRVVYGGGSAVGGFATTIILSGVQHFIGQSAILGIFIFLATLATVIGIGTAAAGGIKVHKLTTHPEKVQLSNKKNKLRELGR